jgi:hypothetical protein
VRNFYLHGNLLWGLLIVLDIANFVASLAKREEKQVLLDNCCRLGQCLPCDTVDRCQTRSTCCTAVLLHRNCEPLVLGRALHQCTPCKQL